ncbi:MAG: hypothetical protein ACOCYG_09110, partial [Spirochaetota bacterium]
FGDLHPPQLQALAMESPHLIVARFNEVTSVSPEDIAIQPDLGTLQVTAENGTVTVRTERPAEVGRPYTLEATARDEAGNTLTFMLRVTGYNPSPARLIINEFTCQGSGNHPDMVELLVTDGGNLGGVVFYAGSPSEHAGSLTFPAVQVESGDFILVHLKPEGIDQEINEIDATDESGGLNAHPEARDFWSAEPTGLSGNNGAVSVYAYQDGPVLDAVIYSNRSYDPEARYGSFGTKAAQVMIEEVAEDGGWRIAGETVRPEDAVDPEDSTATRSISRGSDSEDTDTAGDWHITPTRGSTFGSVNTDETYEGR